ncbi:group-specific protein [Salipaludibacillus sp. CUR1]|uniref:group-specific protein n=1 Tax=Salipaludibacillus sp. CUR1 TaxID=2820003 RepID=UPI001E5DC2BA|nr:group-specific protein [Salipaludibacillus sp. CUR1]MCE7791899.1 group-specific protein [Salipaludibacillus sp. CUR1]
MGECNLDHSKKDVLKKFESQRENLPENLSSQWVSFLENDLTQSDLNMAFHLLKKYDLASEDERREREKKMKELFQSY